MVRLHRTADVVKVRKELKELAAQAAAEEEQEVEGVVSRG